TRSLFLILSDSYLPTLFFTSFFMSTTSSTIYPLSLHYALPISLLLRQRQAFHGSTMCKSIRRFKPAPQDAFKKIPPCAGLNRRIDRKSTRLNSSHGSNSYAVSCLKKKKTV